MKTLYFDGYRNSTGAGYLVCDISGNTVSSQAIGNKTNNEAEYYGALKALELIEQGGIIYTDSKLVEGQVMLNWKVKAHHLRTYVENCKSMAKRKKVSIVWIPRHKNLAGLLIEEQQKDTLLQEYQNLEL